MVGNYAADVACVFDPYTGQGIHCLCHCDGTRLRGVAVLAQGPGGQVARRSVLTGRRAAAALFAQGLTAPKLQVGLQATPRASYHAGTVAPPE